MVHELVFGQQTNINRFTMDFYKKVKIFKVRGPGSHPKPFSILIKLGMCIAILSSCNVIIAKFLVQELVLGLQTNINRYKKKVAVFEVRGPGSPTKLLSILIKLSICIDIWPSYIAATAAC